MFSAVVYWTVLAMIAFIIAQQLRPVGEAPRLRAYGLNILISLSTAYLSLPLGTAAGLWSSQLRHLLPWNPVSFSFHTLGALPMAGPGREILAMIFFPLFLHDSWFYWSHRIEDGVPILSEFDKIHHSDRRMNTSTWARDHFLQESWRGFFSLSTLGMIIDLHPAEGGRAALYSAMFLVGLSMFYHSAIRVQLPWLDRILVTPQVHRIHHSVNGEHHNQDFADALPVSDIVCGTCHCAVREATGLGPDSPAPRSLLSAQLGPLVSVGRVLRPTMRDGANKQERAAGN
jgi:sterol desaturase/sphingolipid hydroxylase (fatty acid hydroxylase superfamily)